MSAGRYNIARAFAEMAARCPYRTAIVLPSGRDRQGRQRTVQLSFRQLHQLSDRYAHGLFAHGLERGQRVLVMIRPGADLIAVTFALLKLGAVPVLIDPGMGRRALLQCVGETEPAALVGIPLAHLLRRLFPRPFRTLRRAVAVAGRWPGTPALAALCPPRAEPFPIADTGDDDEAAVAFTSGSTGIPKGVVYRHGIFRAQLELMRREMDVREGEVHLAVMYIFALFNPALGVTTVIPEMDPAKSAKVDPAALVEAIESHGVTLSVGGPTVFRRLAEHCLQHGLRLPSLRHLFLFGAPVAPELVRQLLAVLDGGRVYTPFGATEALPLTLIDGAEILAETAARTAAGGGVCVGRPLPGHQLRVIASVEGVIPEWRQATELGPGELGEVVVRGPVVTREYLHRPQQTARAKIPDEGGLWHRLGDLGTFDAQGRLWICGRQSHRVDTAAGPLLPACEAIFEAHPEVVRCALVGVGPAGRQQPVLVVEAAGGKLPRRAAARRLRAELLALGAEHEATRAITTFLFHPGLPVDVRHNAKILREPLARWAAERLGGRMEGGG